MNIYELIERANELALECLEQAEEVKPEVIGMDKRSAYILRICHDFIAVELKYDKSLQYYGGFEYVDPDYRLVIGEYVFYSCECPRIQDHINSWIESTNQG